MNIKIPNHLKFAPALLVIVLGMALIIPPAFANKSLEGRWSVNITIPESPNSNSNKTFTVHFDVSPRDGNLHGRLNITDEQDRTVGGVWRQVGKKVFITYELPCSGEEPCASLVMIGKVKKKKGKLKKGTVIVMWDTPNEQNPALFDTSNGKFSGDLLL